MLRYCLLPARNKGSELESSPINKAQHLPDSDAHDAYDAFQPESYCAEIAHRQQGASKNKRIQQELGEQMAVVKARHKQEAAAELAAAKKAEDEVKKWKLEEARKEGFRKDAMLKLKVWQSHSSF